MGGTRFSEIGETVRVTRAEHDAIAADVIERLRGLGIAADPVRFLKSKTDFGDIDLVCARSQTHGSLADEDALGLEARDRFIAESVGAIGHSRGQMRNPALHMLIRRDAGLVQVDLVSIADHLLDFASNHMAWGDVGTMVAMVGRQMGLKIGMTGIHLTMDVPGEKLRAAVPLDWRGTLEMLGFDADAHARGFETRAQTFEWLAGSRYFDPRIYALERQTNYSRQRAQKRPGYMEMLDWIERDRPVANYDWGDRKGDRTAEHHAAIMARFPEVEADFATQIAAREKGTDTAPFFNAEAVSAVTGVTGKRLQFVLHAIVSDIGMDGIAALASSNDEAGLAEVAMRHAGAGEGKTTAADRRRERYLKSNPKD